MNKGFTRRDFLKVSASLPLLTLVDLAQAGDPTLRPGLPSRYRGTRATATPSLCEMCFWRCGILGKRQDGQLLAIEGNPDHPLNQGRLCARGLAGTQLLYDPDRLKYPLVRVGERGEGRWRRVSWDEALDRIAAGLRDTIDTHGPDSIAYFPHGKSAAYFKTLMQQLSASVYSSASFGQCRGPRDTGYKLTFGMPPGSPERTDFEFADAILLVGSHLGENVHTSHVRDFVQAVSRGAKLIVVDPRYSVAASKADLWLPIRPGTDIALLLGLMHCLIEENLYDHDFVQKNCEGFTELKQAVAHADPRWTAAITNLPSEQIVEAARVLGRARPKTVIHPGRFTAWYGTDTQRSRALAILTALLGAWGRRGGMFLPSPMKLGGLCCDTKQAGVTKKASFIPKRHPFSDEGYPYQDVLNATLSDEEQRIKLWFLYGTNVLHSMPSAQRTVEALKKLDFVFMVDILPTEPALYADVILPEATYLERYDTPINVASAKQPFIALRQPVVKAMYETRDPYWIAKRLAERLDVAGCFDCDTIADAIDRQFSEIGTSLAEVARTGFLHGEGKPYLGANRRPRFRTPSGRIELYSRQLAAAGLDPVPIYRQTRQAPEGYVRLLSGRSPYHTFTRTMNNAWLAEMAPTNPVWLNDRVAAAVALSDGDLVELENEDGIRVGPVPAKVTPGIRPDAVFLAHGWGQHSSALRVADGKGASANRLLSRFEEDPESGATGLRVNFIRLIRNNQALDIPSAQELGIPPEPETTELPRIEPAEPPRPSTAVSDETGPAGWEPPVIEEPDPLGLGLGLDLEDSDEGGLIVEEGC